MKKITIYTTPTCHFCHMAKDFFKERGFEYKEYDVAIDLEKRKEMIDKTHQMGVPVIDIDGQTIIGFDKATLSKALGI